MHHPNRHRLHCFKIVGCDPLVSHGKKFAGKEESELTPVAAAAVVMIIFAVVAAGIVIVVSRDEKSWFPFCRQTFHFLSHCG